MTPLSGALLAARRSGGQIAFDPCFADIDEEQAYAVQAQVAAGMKTRPAGWKVGRSPEGRPFAAPIFASDAFSGQGPVPLPTDEPFLSRSNWRFVSATIFQASRPG